MPDLNADATHTALSNVTVAFTIMFPDRSLTAVTPRHAGCGVAVELDGHVLILTAAHVVRQLRLHVPFPWSPVRLAIHGRDAWPVDRNSLLLQDPRSDAGAIVLSRQTASTLVASNSFLTLHPRTGIAPMSVRKHCLIAGMPRRYVTPRRLNDGSLHRESRLRMILGEVRAVDRRRYDVEALYQALTRDDQDGMSGCGCYEIAGTEEKINLQLRAVHSSTVPDGERFVLREVRIEEHLRLLATRYQPLRATIVRSWPAADPDRAWWLRRGLF